MVGTSLPADPTKRGGSGRDFGEGDGVAEGSEPFGVIAGEPLGVQAVEVVATQLAVRLAVLEDVVGDHEEAVGDGDDGLLVPAALDEPPVLRREVAVACADGAPGALDERRAQRPVGDAGAAAQTLAGALVVAWAETGPGGGMAGGGKTAHVRAEFGDDGLGCAARDPGNRVEPRQRIAVRRGERRDVAIAGGDRLVEELDVAQELR